MKYCVPSSPVKKVSSNLPEEGLVEGLRPTQDDMKPMTKEKATSNI